MFKNMNNRMRETLPVYNLTPQIASNILSVISILFERTFLL